MRLSPSQARPAFTAAVRSLQISSILAPLGAIGYLAAVTSRQAAALQGPLLIGGFTATQVSCAIAAAAALAYLIVPTATAAARARATRAGVRVSEGALFSMYAVRATLSTVLLTAILAALGAAWLADGDSMCLVGSTAAGLLSLLHIPSVGRVRSWIEREQMVR